MLIHDCFPGEHPSENKNSRVASLESVAIHHYLVLIGDEPHTVIKPCIVIISPSILYISR